VHSRPCLVRSRDTRIWEDNAKLAGPESDGPQPVSNAQKSETIGEGSNGNTLYPNEGDREDNGLLHIVAAPCVSPRHMKMQDIEYPQPINESPLIRKKPDHFWFGRFRPAIFLTSGVLLSA
jgi:hypothetical protein